MRGESQYYRGPAGYGYAHEDEEYWYGRPARWLLLTASLLTGLLLAVITVHLAGPWAAVPGLGR